MKLRVRDAKPSMSVKEIYTIHLQTTIDDTSVSYIKQPPGGKLKKYFDAVWHKRCVIVATNNIATWRNGLSIKYEVQN